jgi:hypothetical protein
LVNLFSWLVEFKDWFPLEWICKNEMHIWESRSFSFLKICENMPIAMSYTWSISERCFNWDWISKIAHWLYDLHHQTKTNEWINEDLTTLLNNVILICYSHFCCWMNTKSKHRSTQDEVDIDVFIDLSSCFSFFFWFHLRVRSMMNTTIVWHKREKDFATLQVIREQCKCPPIVLCVLRSSKRERRGHDQKEHVSGTIVFRCVLVLKTRALLIAIYSLSYRRMSTLRDWKRFAQVTRFILHIFRVKP